MKQFNRFIDPKRIWEAFQGWFASISWSWSLSASFRPLPLPSFMFGRYGLEMAEKQEYVEKIINGNGISYLISVSIGVLLFALIGKAPSLKEM